MNGLGKADRERLSKVLRETRGTISVTEAAQALGMPRSGVAKLLSRWAKKGWLMRVRRGLYIPVPLESRTADVPLEDAWVVADKLYSPCYIGGWSAAEYWDLTEQIFRTVVVMTVQRPRDRKPVIRGTEFLLRTIADKAMFGLKAVWRGQVKVKVSDPARTIIDMLNDPQLGGGLRSTVDMFINYLNSGNKNLELLMDYGDQLGNGAVFKRLGFLLEKYAGDETGFIDECRSRLTTGNAKLDPTIKTERLLTRWRLWVPERHNNAKAAANGSMNNRLMSDEDTILIGDTLVVSRAALKKLAQRYHIQRLVLFGSAARGELRPDSDVDLLVEFEQGRAPSLGGMVRIHDDFAELFGGRKVDVATSGILNNPYRRKTIERDMQELYAA